MPDDNFLREFYGGGGDKESGGNLTSLITGEQPKRTGLVGRFADLYDRFDQPWLPEDDFSKEKYVEENYGLPGRMLGGLNRGVRNVTRGVVDSLVGSPVRALGTAGTIASGGLTKVPQAVRGGIAALDAVDAARSGIRSYDAAQEGRYGAAVGNALGAGLQGAGALSVVGRPVTRNTRSYAQPVPEVVRPKPIIPSKPDTLNVSSTLAEPIAPIPVQTTLAGGPGGPTPFSRTVIRNIPKGLLEEGGTIIGPGTRKKKRSPIRGGTTFPNDASDLVGAGGNVSTRMDVRKGADSLVERASRELTALHLPITDRTLKRYVNEPDFRTKIQANAEKIGATGRYESTVGTRYVQEAPVPIAKRNEPTVDDIRQELKSRGVQATDQFLAKIRKDTNLQDKLGLREMFMEGVPMPAKQVKGYLTIGKTQIPEPIPTQTKLFDAADDDVIKLDKVLSHKDVSPEVKAQVQQVKNNLSKSSWFGRATNSFDTSMERDLEKMGPVGTEIARQVKIASTDKPIRFNSYIKDVRADIEKTSAEDFEKVVDYLEGKNLKPSDAIKSLGDRMKKVLDTTGADLESTGLLEKGVRQTYWPHRYPKDSTLRESMAAQGMTEDQIKENLQRIKDFREQKISGEYSRNDLNVPGYRKDKDVFIDHLREVSNRVEDAGRFGAKDLNDPKSPISMLISRSEDPERARELMTRILRGDATSTETQKNVASAVRKYATASQLSLASISNFGGTLPVLVRSTTSDAINGVGRAFQKELPDMKFMENTNLFRKFSGGFAETINDNNRMYKVFGIEGSQNWLNRYAGAVGNSYAQTLFETLKRNPGDAKATAQLQDLVLDNADTVLKQDALTDKQLERAMVRMAEVTQGITENRKLPYFWNKEGLATIPQIFMRTSFQTTKAMKDAIKMDPVRAIPKLLGGGLLIGEVIGDVKEGAKTAAQVGMNSLQQMAGVKTEDKNLVDEYKKNIGLSKDDDTQDRFSFTRKYLTEIDPELAKNDLVVRALGNLEQSFALGMPADILRALSDSLDQKGGDQRNRLSEAAKLFWAWDEGNQLTDVVADGLAGNFRNVSREALKRVPFVGRGAAREVQTTAQQKHDNQYGEVKW
jgi:hypothetical protein